ncbi:restriction endonuclease [Halobacteriales archaeon QS_8_69_26]|nr:MAG: restriction endonuclease [Halobacteriales archaeon QS_8_69_26]
MSQATLSEGPYVNSNLFSGHYLDDRLEDRDEWDCDGDASEVMAELTELWEFEGGLVTGYNEDDLLDNWIDEVLDRLGFGTSAEMSLPDGGGFVDILLFEDTPARREAADVYINSEDETELFERGIGIVEAKQWDADFTERFSEDRAYRDASHQIKHYLERTPESLQWGILTNGRKWRLYGTRDYGTEIYYEVDLPELLEQGDLEAFKYFYVFFRPEAFRESAGTTFLDSVWSESETAAQELGEDLQDNVFTALRVLGRGFVETNDLDIDPDDEDALDELKEQSLVLLYRLMFVLYAEARGLIHPEGQDAVAEYEENFSLDQLRLDVHDEIGEVDEGFDAEYSEYSTTMWSRLDDLFHLIDEGEETLGIPPYNGGLFDREDHAFLAENEVSNRHLAEVVYRLSTTENGDGRYVLADYADLDTRHLGSVYEGLLEHQFRIAPEDYAAVAEDGGQVWKPATEVTVAEAVETVPQGGLYVVNDEGERKATGAYYTPDYVVTYIVEETVGPLVEGIREDLVDQGFERGTQEYLGPFLQRVRDLTILDPAMGSGHFLTRATGYLAERVMEEVREVETELGVAFDEQHVRREIAKECIYGVDVNGMAVELAKLSMWLETLAADRPLAFLDHHFKQGNSLVGSDLEAIEDLESDAPDAEGQYSLTEFGATREGTIERLMEIYAEFLAIENEGIEDIAAMKRKYAEIERDDLRRRLVAIANVHTAENFDLAVPSGAYERMARALEDGDEWADLEDEDWFKTAKELGRTREFFHWKLEFPEVFYREGGESRDDPGFDAVIGNPPWVSNWKIQEEDELLTDALESLYDEVTTGHWDLYVPFVFRALLLTRNQGRHSFITPNALATEKYGRDLREFLTSECHINQLVDFGETRVFEEVDRQYLVYIVSTDPSKNSCEIIRYDGVKFTHGFSIDQTEFLEYNNNSFRIDLTKEDLNLREKILAQSFNLGHLCFVNPGVVAHSAEDSPVEFDKCDVIDDQPGDGKKKYISGSDIDRHEIIWSGEYIDYESKQEHFHRSKFPELFESEKIMVSGISGSDDSIKSCFDDEGYYTNHNILHAVQWSPVIKTKSSSMNYEPKDNVSEYDLRYVAGIVNSRLNNYYFGQFHATGTLQGSYSGVYPEDVRQFPIREIEFDTDHSDEDHKKSALEPYYGQNGSFTRDMEENVLDRIKNVPDEVIHDVIGELTSRIIPLNKERNNINLSLLDYIEPYSEGQTLAEIGRYPPPPGVGDSMLTDTAADHEGLRIGTVSVDREGPTRVTIRATARYKPDDQDAHETDQWGYTETDPMPAIELADLTELAADLVEAFVPVAVEEAGGFAGFRDNATKTNSPVDRLEALTLPDPDDVADGLRRYREAKARAAELDEKIERTDELIDEIVYELYGLTDEEIEIVEEAVGGD